MATIYCIPGTGVDKRIFSRLELQGHEIRHIKWLLPYKKEELEAYALRLGKQIDPVKPFVLLGVSFGGMLSVALARHLHPDRIIIVSSCKSRKELPHRIRWLRLLPFHRLFPDATYIKAASLSRKVFGFLNQDDSKLFLEMLHTAPKGFYRLAVDCIVRWNPHTSVPGIIHIHGTRDKVLPFKRVKANHVIQGGGHNLMATHAKEISAIILQELEGL